MAPDSSGRPSLVDIAEDRVEDRPPPVIVGDGEPEPNTPQPARRYVTIPAATEPAPGDVLVVEEVDGDLVAAGLDSLVTTLGDRDVRERHLKPVMSSPPTITLGAREVASVIAGGTFVSAATAVASKVRVLGAELAAAGAGFPDNGYRKVVSQTAGTLNADYSIAFMLLGVDEFEFDVKEITSTGYRVSIDGALCSADYTTLATNAGGRHKVHIDGIDALTVPRRIDIELAGAYFGGYTAPAGAIVVPIPAPTGRFMAFGDSFFEGSGAPGYDGMGTVMGRLLGFDDTWASGYGGSGYVQTGTVGVTKTFIQRVADITNYSPDVLVVHDQDTATAANTLGAAATTFWEAVRTALPNSVLIGVANILPNQTQETVQDAAVRAAVEAVGGLWIPTHGWIMGTGRVGTPAGNGDADVHWGSDNAHPSRAGHRYVAGRAAHAAARKMLADKRISTPAC